MFDYKNIIALLSVYVNGKFGITYSLKYIYERGIAMASNKKVVKINEIDELKQRQEVAKSVLANIVQIGANFLLKFLCRS